MGKLKNYVVKKRFFKYGTHEEGEQVSFDPETAKGLVPKFLEEVEVKGKVEEPEPEQEVEQEQKQVSEQEQKTEQKSGKNQQGAKSQSKSKKTKKDE